MEANKQYWVRHSADPQLAELLQVEHDEIERSFHVVILEARCGNWPSCREAWSPFVDRLLRHMDFEDNHLLPAFEQEGGINRVIGFELRKQHESLREAIQEISERIEQDEVTVKEMDRLLEALERHNKHEDESFHPWITGLPGPRIIW